MELGRLKKVLKETCEICGTHLQIRSHGEIYYGRRFFSKEEIFCPMCEMSTPIKPEKRRAPRNIDDEWED